MCTVVVLLGVLIVLLALCVPPVAMFVYLTTEPAAVHGTSYHGFCIGWLKTNLVRRLFLTWRFSLEVLFRCGDGEGLFHHV